MLGVTSGAAGEVRAGALRPSSSAWVPFEYTLEAYEALLEAFPRVDGKR